MSRYPSTLDTQNNLLVAENIAQTVINVSGGIDGVQTSFDVGDASVFPSVGEFIVSADTELMLIASIAGNVLNVDPGGRGYDGTVAAPHPNTTPVSLVVAAAYHNRVTDAIEKVEREGQYWAAPVETMALASPPAITPGYKYIVGSGAIGAWLGEDSNIAIGNDAGTGWDFHTMNASSEGLLVWVKDLNEYYQWDGSEWDIIAPLTKDKAEYVEVTNNTGGVFVPNTVLVVSGHDSANNIPEASTLSDLSQYPIGLAVAATPDGDSSYILKRGARTIPAFDTTLAAVGDPVYSNSAGQLTLTPSDRIIGTVLTLNVNGTIYVNIGGSGGESSSDGGTFHVGDPTRIAAMDIDGAINTIGTNYSLYQVPASTYLCNGTISVTNRNYTVSKIRIAHIPGALGTLSNDDYITYDMNLQPYQTIVYDIPGMVAGDTILVRSDTTNVNFSFTAQTSSDDLKWRRIGSIDIDGTVNAIDTDYAAITTANRYAGVRYYICNRNPAAIASIRTAHIDSNIIGALSAEDYILYGETILEEETRGYNTNTQMDSSQILSFRSNISNVNIIVYGYSAI